jgi:ubiquinol-cytochrome c reductase cytochrome c subunit
MNQASAAACLALLLQVSTHAQAADPTAPVGSAQRGQELFLKNTCYSCHGTVGQGGERGAGPRIAPDPFPFAAFEMQLRQPRGNMPRYPEQFVSRQELADIYAYIASIPAARSADTLPLSKP